MNLKLITAFLKENCIPYTENESMALHTTFKTGGNADVFVLPDTAEQLKGITGFCRENNIPVTVIGNGSNILVSDRGIEGVVITLAKLNSITLQDTETVTCGAGVPLTAVCLYALKHSLSGLEFAYGIPGSVGGALYMNAGAYGGEIKNVIFSADVLDKNGNITTVLAEDMCLGYRTSIFKTDKSIILSATFKLQKGDEAEIKSNMDELMSRRRDKQPLEYPSAGSTFKRPAGNFAGALIEQSGLKGTAVGGAMVSEKHAGFIINYNKATSGDVLRLIEKVQQSVFEKHGVMLEPEVIYLGR